MSEDQLKLLYGARQRVEAGLLKPDQLVLEKHWRVGWICWRVVKVGKRHVIGRLVFAPREWPMRRLQKLREKSGKTYIAAAYEGPAYCDVISQELFNLMGRRYPEFVRA